jgi:hypothetical protein
MACLTGLLSGGVLCQLAIYGFMAGSHWRALEMRLMVGAHRADAPPDMLTHGFLS